MKNAASFAIAAAITCLAASLFYIGSQLPELNTNLSRINTLGEKTVSELPAALEVAQQYETHIEPLLAEVAASREVADKALTESAAYRQQLPAIMAQMETLQSQLATLQGQLPNVLERVDLALSESEQWRPITQVALVESEAWRANIPTYLARSEQLVANAREAGKEASAGAISGIFSGAIALPFQALENVGSFVDPRSLSAKHLTDEDKKNMRTAVIELLQNPSVKIASWTSEKSSHSGTLEIIDSQTTDAGICHTFKVKSEFKRGKTDTSNREICKGRDGTWAISE